jgi:hypothetical protein
VDRAGLRIAPVAGTGFVDRDGFFVIATPGVSLTDVTSAG